MASAHITTIYHKLAHISIHERVYMAMGGGGSQGNPPLPLTTAVALMRQYLRAVSGISGSNCMAALLQATGNKRR